MFSKLGQMCILALTVILNNTKKSIFSKFSKFCPSRSAQFNFLFKFFLKQGFAIRFRRFEQKFIFRFFEIFLSQTRYPRLWLILAATSCFQSIYPLSCRISTYRWTILLSHLIITLLVWLQWWSKVAIFSENRENFEICPSPVKIKSKKLFFSKKKIHYTF